jgi:hypothetical protein
MKQKVLLFLYLLSCTFLIGYLYHFPLTGIDDANIYFVYMKNFANGHGFVYNIGGERVEGFTSVFWALIGSFFFRFTNHIEICLLVINFCLLYFSLMVAIKIIELFTPSTKENTNYTIIFLGLLIIFPGFYDWTLFSLLETGLWTFELILVTYLLIIPYLKEDFTFEKSSWYFALLFPFLIITRPESILLGVVIIIIRFSQLIIERKNSQNIIKQVTLLFIVYCLSLSILTKWRLYYFGYPFPNTYYIKMTDGFLNNLKEGAVYFTKYTIRTNPLIILTIPLVFLWIYNFMKKRTFTNNNKIIFILIILSAVGISIPFYTGGDHFRLSRFYQVFTPIFYLCLLFILQSFQPTSSIFSRILSSKKNILICLVILSSLPLNNLYYLFYNKTKTIAMEFHIAKQNREIGNHLNSFFYTIKKPSIGVVAAGGIKYTYNGYVNDVLGLNNIEVAHTIGDRPISILKSHRAFNKTVFLKQYPDLFIFDFVTDTSRYIPYAKRKNIDNEFGSKVIKHIYNDSNFNRQYSSVFIYNKKTNEFLFSYCNKNFLKIIDTSFYKISVIK